MNAMIAWFCKNSVAANLLMIAIFLSGFRALFVSIPTEVFPEFELDMVSVRVPFRGATPSDVEEGITIKIEEALQDLEGIKKMTSRSSEGAGSVTIEIDKGYNTRDLLDDIKNRVDAINTFPAETEKPVISLAERKGSVISVVLAADMSEKDLKELGKLVREEILALPSVTQASLQGSRPYEVTIEVSENTLRQYGLTLEDVRNTIAQDSLDLPAGRIKTVGGDILLRTKGQAYNKKEFEDIVLIAQPNGTLITVGDIAKVIDGFEETPLITTYNGNPCVLVYVTRVGNQNAISLAQDVKDYIEQRKASLPSGVEIGYWDDRSRIVSARLKTLSDGAMMGMLLVFIVLTLFLRPWLAFWVCIGIPVCFSGALSLMPFLGATINMFSLFGFILVLGILVDDAIVTGENIFAHQRLYGKSPEQAAIDGAQEVAMPVIFGVLTTVVAFIPLLMGSGIRGKIFAQIALVVIPVLLFSLVESKLILPTHLKHVRLRTKSDNKKRNLFDKVQDFFADGMEHFAEKIYQPFLKICCAHRYLTYTGFVAVFVIIVSLVMSNRIRFSPFPRIASETATASLTMQEGTPIETTRKFIKRIENAATELRDEYTDPTTNKSLITAILSTTGGQGFGRRGGSNSSSGQSYLGEVSIRLMPPEQRTQEIDSREVVNKWRAKIGLIPGAQSLNFRAEIGRSSDPIDIQLTSKSFDDMKLAAEEIKVILGKYPDLFDISDSFEGGKPEIKIAIKPEAKIYNISQRQLANQARDAFFGGEAQRIQRGDDDVRVIVRYPENERKSIASLENMRIRPNNTEQIEIPFSSVAEAELGRSFSSIVRIDRNRAINVTSDADKEKANLEAIKSDLVEQLDSIVARYPGMAYTLEGEAREQQEQMASLRIGGAIVFFAIYAMLAIPFKSYFQPLIVMSVIPFGLVGAVIGHIIMGYSLSMMSLFGMLALSGVVVNDSLVMVDYINKRRREGFTLREAVFTAGVRRFRAIILTSVTTFAGLVPMMFEKSTQAQFVIPMGISLGWGIIFATAVTLIMVPINYLFLEDLKFGMNRYWSWQVGKKQKSRSELESVASN